jgi:hypothetical protein
MMDDFRETLVACYEEDCRFNKPGFGIEPTCNLKLIAIAKGGQCSHFEQRKPEDEQT